MIGGAAVYAAALPLADELVLTEIDADFEADTFFPPWDRPQFRQTARAATQRRRRSGLQLRHLHPNRGRLTCPAGGFHVHGPHDHELEHAAAHADPQDLAGRLAVATAIIATVGALFAYMGGATQANAGLYKNDAAIKKTEASNQWNYYQAKSSKQNLAELALELAPESTAGVLRDEIKRYKGEKDEIKQDAEKLEKASNEWNQKSDEQIHQHHRWAQATTALQIAIAMAAIALLTKKPLAAVGRLGLSGVGVGARRPRLPAHLNGSRMARSVIGSDADEIATWNVNSLAIRLPQLLAWLAAAPARRDVPAGDQARGREVPARRVRAAGYALRVLRAEDLQRRRAAEPRAGAPTSSRNIPGFDDPAGPRDRRDGRRPARRSAPISRTGRRQAATSSPTRCAGSARCATGSRDECARHPELVLMGDYNIAPEDHDVHDPAAWEGQIHVHAGGARPLRSVCGARPARRLPPVRAAAEKLLSWWDYRSSRSRRNRGLRIDHILVSEALSRA